jgi:hypothetical protein
MSIPKFRHGIVAASLLLAPLIVGACSTSNGFLFLTRAGDGTTGSAEETQAYYAKMTDSPPEKTLEEWKKSRCFDKKETSAFYYNASDLGLGREMRCATCPPDIRKGLVSCVVSNHGVPQGLDLVDPQFLRDRNNSIKFALDGLEKFLADKESGLNPTRGASVAMDFDKDRPDKVRFYIYDATNPALLAPGSPGPDSLIPGLQLDGEGAALGKGIKFMRNCLSCHGGRYDSATNQIIGAQFLDFDVGLFVFSDDPDVCAKKPKFAKRADNLDKFRELNRLVRDVDGVAGGTEIVKRIDGSYSKPVSDASAVYLAEPDYFLAGWPKDKKVREFKGKDVSAADFFKTAVRPYCGMCHFSQTPGNNFLQTKTAITFASSSQWFEGTINKHGVERPSLEVIKEDVCGGNEMPHSEVTRANLLRDSKAYSLICN